MTGPLSRPAVGPASMPPPGPVSRSPPPRPPRPPQLPQPASAMMTSPTTPREVARIAALYHFCTRSACYALCAMTLRKIAQIGHPVLRERARELTRAELETPEIQRFIDDLVETMRDAN